MKCRHEITPFWAKHTRARTRFRRRISTQRAIFEVLRIPRCSSTQDRIHTGARMRGGTRRLSVDSVEHLNARRHAALVGGFCRTPESAPTVRTREARGLQNVRAPRDSVHEIRCRMRRGTVEARCHPAPAASLRAGAAWSHRPHRPEATCARRGVAAVPRPKSPKGASARHFKVRLAGKGEAIRAIGRFVQAMRVVLSKGDLLPDDAAQ